MQEVLLVIHLILALAIVVTVLLQRSEGGALGIGGGGGGGMSARGSGNVLTRATAILAACFFATSMALTILADRDSGGRSIMDSTAAPGQSSGTSPETQDEPALPQVPISD